MQKKTSLWCLVSLVGVSLVAAPARADNEKGTAVIKGKVVFAGDPPATKTLPPMNADAVCAKAHSSVQPDQGTIVYKKAGNTIPYVFVYVKSGIKGKYDPPKEAAQIDQNGCQYKPHVQGMVVGQDLNIKSSDPTAHNIHALPNKSEQFNISQPNQGVIPRTSPFTKPEIMVKVKCDVHAWMSSYIGVCPHPFFAVTKSHDDDKASDAEKGTFAIKDLPAGDYEIEAWHENFGKISQKVTVKDGETKEIDFKLGPTKGADASQKVREVTVTEKGELASQK